MKRIISFVAAVVFVAALAVPAFVVYWAIHDYEILISTFLSMASLHVLQQSREYEVAGLPARRTASGCDYDDQINNGPNLFVFAYDWRRDIVTTTKELKDYMGCIRKFYPDSQVNVVDTPG